MKKPKNWKRGVWTCFALIVVESLDLGLHLADLRVQYMVNVSNGGSAPFSVYAMPAIIGHGAVLLLLLGAGVFCWRKAWMQNQEKE